MICALIRALPEARWTAVKLTPHAHAAAAASSSCEVREETDPHGRGDTARFLAAGAERAFRIDCPEGRLESALPALSGVLAGSVNAILESGGIVEILPVDLYVAVLDPSLGEWKPAARARLERAEAIVEVGPPGGRPAALPGGRLHFHAATPGYECPGLVELVRSRLR